jgi:hypothetical protein
MYAKDQIPTALILCFSDQFPVYVKNMQMTEKKVPWIFSSLFGDLDVTEDERKYIWNSG